MARYTYGSVNLRATGHERGYLLEFPAPVAPMCSRDSVYLQVPHIIDDWFDTARHTPGYLGPGRNQIVVMRDGREYHGVVGDLMSERASCRYKNCRVCLCFYPAVECVVSFGMLIRHQREERFRALTNIRTLICESEIAHAPSQPASRQIFATSIRDSA